MPPTLSPQCLQPSPSSLGHAHEVTYLLEHEDNRTLPDGLNELSVLLPITKHSVSLLIIALCGAARRKDAENPSKSF